MIKLHYNVPQLKAMLVNCKENYHVWSRGTGKSEGLIAPRSEQCVHLMPRSTGVFVASTYQQLLTRTLGPVIKGWERLGYRKDRDFFVCKRPPKSWGWREPLTPPLSYDYFISWYNGSGIHLVSQDRPGTSNGLSIDWIIGDEAKFLKKDKIDNELLPANRGNLALFGHLAEHHSLMFCTDMPTDSIGKWILDKQSDMDIKAIELIIYLQLEVNRLNQLGIKSTKLSRYMNELALLRKSNVYYSEANVFDNIHALGVDYVKQMKRTLPDNIFRTAILNERPNGVTNGFYGSFDYDTHTYDSFDYSYIDSLGDNFDKLSKVNCLMDGDLDKDAPLYIAMDYGSSINNIVVGQLNGNSFKVIKHLYVLHPKRLRDVLIDFCNYYGMQRNKDVVYLYDHTAVGTDATRTTTYADEVMSVLTDNAWRVNAVNIGQAPSHTAKHLFLSLILKGDERLPILGINRQNCKDLITSIQNAPAKESRNGIEKDKRSERNYNIPQQEATHPSDAFDTLLFGLFAKDLRHMPEFIDNIFH